MPQCHRTQASTTRNSAHPSHVTWPRRAPKATVPPLACVSEGPSATDRAHQPNPLRHLLTRSMA
eukprot:7832070-Pyramimonas_sp.AAC.1